jgi:putative transposase
VADGGKPKALYVDNGCEFRSEALCRGCEQHGIALS